MTGVIDEIKKLNLPANQYTVFGSGLLDAWGLRPAHDIDLVVTEQLYRQLKHLGWKEDKKTKPCSRLVFGCIEAFCQWDFSELNYTKTPEFLIENSIHIDGVNFVNPEEVIRFKTALARPKDLIDIESLKDHLKSKD